MSPHNWSPRMLQRLAGEEPAYRIDQWARDGKGSIERVLALADNLVIARAAFDKAVEIYPHEVLTLRKRAHVIACHSPGDSHERG